MGASEQRTISSDTDAIVQCPLTGSRGQALEEWERPVRQYEAQNLDTIKAAILTHNRQDPE